ncbi:hypothetical protein [Gemmatimonas sp.]|uniref:hypothetical protein n=1 Tax=Gemmatimonas sp. TaxID=1962908 RepID=UPI003DA36B96
MASGNKVTVTINGEEHVSEATDKADAALSGLSGKVPGYAKVVAGMAVAYQAVQAAIGKVRDVVVQSFTAYDELATSQRKLEGTSKLTGLSLEYLNSITEHGRKQFGLSRVEANDYATEVAKLAVKSGDASKATDLLSGFLNIGAARGLSAADSLKAAQQAILGIDEGTDKLFGKNPSVLYDDYAKAVGGTASKFNDTEKAAALAYAVMDGGNKVVGSYAEFLNSAQGKQALLNSQIQETKARLGEAMQPMRAFVVDALGQLAANSASGVSAVGSLTNALVAFLSALSPVVRPVLTLGTALLQVFSVGAEQIVLSVRRLSGTTAVAVGSMLQSFGTLAEKGGNFLRLLGINVVAEAGASIRQFGEDMVNVNKNKLLKVEYDALDFTKRQERIWDEWRGTTTAKATDAMTGVEGAVTTATPKVDAAAGKMGKAVSDKLGEPLKVVIGLTEGAITRLGQAAKDQLPAEQSEKFLTHMQGLVVQAGEAREKMLGLGDNTKKASDSTRDTARDIERVARSALDAAVAFGVIDKAAANTLNSVINIASGIAGVVSGDVTSGVAAILTGITNVVASMLGGDAERKRLLGQNNAALSKLSRDIGALKLNITGEDFAKAENALGSVIGQLKGGRGAANENDVRNALYAQGLTMEDLDRIAKEFGIEFRTKSGAVNVESIGAILNALRTSKPGRLGMEFGGQLDFFRESQRIDGATGLTKISDLITYLRQAGGVTALDGLDTKDPEALRNALRALRTQMNNGKGVQGLGKLTGSQFMDILVGLIGDIDGLTSGSGASSGGDITVPTGGGGGTVSAPTETIQAVVKAMDTNIGTILTGHTAIHERIAMATESSATSLRSIDGKMDSLIAVTAGQIDATDIRLEAMRRMAELERGIRPNLI